MTNQEKKEYLNQYLESKQRFYILAEEMNQLRSDAVRVTPVITDMPSGQHVNDKIARAIEKLEQCADSLEAEAQRIKCTMLAVITAIETVPDTILREILLLRYIDGYPLEKIADKMNYSYDYIRHRHGEALTAVIIKDSTQ